MWHNQSEGAESVKELIKFIETVIDLRQKKKVKHKISDIIMLSLFGLLANADDFVEIEIFGCAHIKILKNYLELPNGIPSHDTIGRVFGIISPEFMKKAQAIWNEILSSDEGEKIKKIFALDGKTQRGNGTDEQKANHIVSAVDEDGFCIGEERVDDKSNEITAIPELIDQLNVKGHIITIDAMGTQTEIAKKIRKAGADYVLALKGNQGALSDDVKLYFDDAEHLGKCAYTKTTEKAHSGIERREYWQTDDIDWLPQKPEWAGLKSIIMTKNTITNDKGTTVEVRYFISSLPTDAKEAARAIRTHWMVESYHWHLDVTFREDANRTLDKTAAFNLNILRKLAINILKLLDVGHKGASLKKKRFAIGTNPQRHIENIMEL